MVTDHRSKFLIPDASLTDLVPDASLTDLILSFSVHLRSKKGMFLTFLSVSTEVGSREK